MIARDSKSYPYLAIAQHYGVDYGEVLRFANFCSMLSVRPTLINDWERDIWKLEKKPFVMLSCLEAKRCLHEIPGCICEIDPSGA